METGHPYLPVSGDRGCQMSSPTPGGAVISGNVYNIDNTANVRNMRILSALVPPNRDYGN